MTKVVSKVTIKAYKFCMLLIISMVCIGCRESIDDFYLYQNSENIEKTRLTNDKAIQIRYHVAVKYESVEVKEFIWERLKDNGYIRCGDISSWESYVKKYTESPMVGIYQNISHYINEEKRKLVLVSLRYYSDEVSSVRKDFENNSRKNQEVMVVEYDVENVNRVKEELSCN